MGICQLMWKRASRRPWAAAQGIIGHGGGGNIAGWSPAPVGLAVLVSQRPWPCQSSGGWRSWQHYLWSMHTAWGATRPREAMSRLCSIKEGDWGFSSLFAEILGEGESSASSRSTEQGTDRGYAWVGGGYYGNSYDNGRWKLESSSRKVISPLAGFTDKV